ncbi:MAG: ankyrin repeat domain-containing protein [Verrucomicrobiales bacterium]
MERLSKRGFAFSVEDFHRAARSGDVKSVEEFLAAGMAVDVPDTNGNTAIGAASQSDAADVVRLLISAGAQVNAPASEGRTPLMLAAASGSAPTVRLLLESNADPKARDPEGWHPLALATWNHRLDAAAVLSAKASAADIDDALLLSTLHGDVEMTDFYLRRGASVFARDSEGHTPLMLAAANGHVSVARRLLDNGANRFELHSTTQWTPAQFAVRAEQESLAKGDTIRAAQARAVADYLSAPAPENGEEIGIFADPRPILIFEPDDPPPDEETSASIAHGKVRIGQSIKDATLVVPAPGFDGLASAWKVTEYREKPAPILLESVLPDGVTARFRKLQGSQERVDSRANEPIAGTSWRLVSVRRRIQTSKNTGEALEASTAVVEIPAGGPRREIRSGQPVPMEEPYAVLEPAKGGQIITARRGEKFKLTGDPKTYAIADIGPDSVVIEDTATRETRILTRR